MSWTNADGLTVLMHEEQGTVQTTGKTVVGVRKALVIDLEDATILIDQALEQAPDQVEYLVLKGELVMQQGNPEQALSSFDRANVESLGLPHHEGVHGFDQLASYWLA